MNEIVPAGYMRIADNCMNAQTKSAIEQFGELAKKLSGVSGDIQAAFIDGDYAYHVQINLLTDYTTLKKVDCIAESVWGISSGSLADISQHIFNVDLEKE